VKRRHPVSSGATRSVFIKAAWIAPDTLAIRFSQARVCYLADWKLWRLTGEPPCPTLGPGPFIRATGRGPALAHTGHAIGDPIAAVGSFIVLFDMLLFGWLVFQGERADAGVEPMASSAR
jgi:hypothetical protein